MHLGVVGNFPEVDQGGGATARGGGAATVNTAMVLWPRLAQMGGRPSYTMALGTLWHDPEVGRRPESCQRRWTAAAEVKKGVADSGGNGAN